MIDWLTEGERDNAGDSDVGHVQTFQDVDPMASRSHHQTTVLVNIYCIFSTDSQLIN